MYSDRALSDSCKYCASDRVQRVLAFCSDLDLTVAGDVALVMAEGTVVSGVRAVSESGIKRKALIVWSSCTYTCLTSCGLASVDSVSVSMEMPLGGSGPAFCSSSSDTFAPGLSALSVGEATESISEKA